MKKFAVAALLVVCGGWIAAEQPEFRAGVELVRIPNFVSSSGSAPHQTN